MHRVIAEVLTLDISTIIWTLIFQKEIRKLQFYKWKSKQYRTQSSNSTSMKGNFKETAEDIMGEKLRVNTFSSTLCTMTNENTTTAYNNHWKWNAWLKFHMELSSVILTTTNYGRIYEYNCTLCIISKHNKSANGNATFLIG